MANRCGQGLRVLLVGFVLFFATSTVLTAQHEGKGDSSSASRSEDQKVVEQWIAQYDRIADQLHVSCPGLEYETAMVRQTILSLDNQQFAGRHGRVYLWTRDGLPVVLSVIMSFQDPAADQRLRLQPFVLCSLLFAVPVEPAPEVFRKNLLTISHDVGFNRLKSWVGLISVIEVYVC